MATVNDIMVFVHGVPQGQDYWESEKTNDKDYIQNFYTNKDKIFKFVAEVRKSGDKRFCYYHYLCYNGNVVDRDNRAGSYFGLTVRLDAHCRDWRTMFHIMDVVYKSAVIGNLLVADGQKLKYSVGRFDSASDILQGLYKETIGAFTKVFANKSINFFGSLNDFSRSSGQVWKDNLGTCDRDEFEEALRKCGKVELSPSYPIAKIEKLKEQYNNELDARQADFNKRLQAIQDESSSGKNKLQDKVKALESQVKQLEGEVDNKKNEKDELLNKVDKAAGILGGLLATLGHQTSREGTPGKENGKEDPKHGAGKHKATTAPSIIKGLLPVANFLLLLFIAASLSFKGCGKAQEGHNGTPGEQAVETDSLERHETENATSLAERSAGELQEPQAQPNEVVKQPAEQANQNLPGNYSIDIKEYTGTGPLTIGKVYTVAVSKTHDKAYMFADGCKVDNETDATSGTIRITPIKETVTISYQYLDGNKKVMLCERTLEAK